MTRTEKEELAIGIELASLPIGAAHAYELFVLTVERNDRLHKLGLASPVFFTSPDTT